MPYMLQAKNYIQIARPNLYNVAYRRVGAYKGMGRLHPTNYLEIGPRPNRIGHTTGQYNTLSGQLSLTPPSLRGFGQSSADLTQLYPAPSGAYDTSSSVDLTQLYPAPAAAYQGATSGAAPIGFYVAGTGSSPSAKPTMPTWLPWALGGAVALLFLSGRRR